jgi:hypothetical protein
VLITAVQYIECVKGVFFRIGSHNDESTNVYVKARDARIDRRKMGIAAHRNRVPLRAGRMLVNPDNSPVEEGDGLREGVFEALREHESLIGVSESINKM